MFDNLGFSELFVVGLLALLVFGPDRLPEMARTAARWIARFRAEASRSIADLKAAADLDDLGADVEAIRSELTGAREDIARTLQEPAEALQSVGAEVKQLSSGGPTGEVPAAVGPPPIDTEAT